MPRKPTAHARLDLLRQQAAAERVKARDLQGQLAAAGDRIEDCGAAIADGYAADDEKAVAGARTAQEQAIGQVKDLQHQVNGALIRIERSQQNLDAYLVDHARDLLAEREQQARTVALELSRSVAETLALAKAYVAERRQQDELVSAVPGATPRADGPAPEHPWEPALRELQRVYQLTPELPPPLPGWQGLEQRTYQDALHRQLADERTAA